MPSLTAADITIVIKNEMVAGPKRFVTGTLAIAGTNTYPNDGIPIPTIQKFGMIRQLDALMIFGVDPTTGTVADYMTRYDKTNNKLFLYVEEAVAAGGPLLESLTSEVPGARTYDFLAIGW